jgi:fructose-bisphosphate aldolase class II
LTNGFDPLPGAIVYNALKDQPVIILATNPRINIGVLEGILGAAKSMNAVVIFELARSEANLNGGYTGLTPEQFAKNIKDAAKKVNHPWYILHADHITIQKGTPEELEDVRNHIRSQIKAGCSSFAIDASFLFNTKGTNEYEQLQRNIEVTTEMANFIKTNVKIKNYGLEVEVGEIGKKDSQGFVYTTVAEAKTFIETLNRNGVFPNLLAIANGSTHGNVYDKNGNPIGKITINIPRTIEIAQAIAPYNVKLAQHGITGTPFELIAKYFPRGMILKGNVGTHWMNIVWDTLKIFDPALYEKIWNWTIETFKPKNPGRSDEQIFGTDGKYGIIKFYNDLYKIDAETTEAIRATAYVEALKFLKAFNARNSVDLVKKVL